MSARRLALRPRVRPRGRGGADVRVGDPRYNAERTVALAARRPAATRRWWCSPSSACPATRSTTCPSGRAAGRRARRRSTRSSRRAPSSRRVIVVGAPLRVERRAVQLRRRDPPRARCSASCPRATCPNYREYYEKRQFRAGARARSATRSSSPAQRVPFGADLRLRGRRRARLRAARRDLRGRLGADPAEHVRRRWRARRCWQPVGQSNITIGKADYRRDAVRRRSRRARSPAYVYTAAGAGESTTDLAWDGQAMICENGDLLAESRALRRRRAADRRRRRPRPDACRTACARPASATRSATTASGCAALRRDRRSSSAMRRARGRRCERAVERFPYVPADPAQPRRALLGGLQHPGAGAGARGCGRPASTRS